MLSPDIDSVREEVLAGEVERYMAPDEPTVDRSPEFDQTHWVPKTREGIPLSSAEFDPLFNTPQVHSEPYSPPWPHLSVTAHGFELRRVEGGELLASTPDLKAAFAAKRLLSGAAR